MNPSVLAFASAALAPHEIAGKRVVEAGALDVNGSVRAVIEALGPASYAGTDLETGPGVDLVCSAEYLPSLLGRDCADVVISTEMLEHAEDWRAAVTGLVRILAPGGCLLLTTRSMGFPYHPHPDDYWRFSVRAMELIMKAAGLDLVRCEPDSPDSPGVLAFARKPPDWAEPAGMSDGLAAVVPGPAVRVNGLQGPEWT